MMGNVDIELNNVVTRPFKIINRIIVTIIVYWDENFITELSN